MNAEKWFKRSICILAAAVALAVLMVWVVDPYFHFHKPFPFISYHLYEERYINDGISRNFDYDAIVTGTSMAQNFRTTEIDALFGTNCVKETFSGAGYMELSANLERALERNGNLRTVIWAMDYNALFREADWDREEEYPDYLYDDSIWNDTMYIFNKDMWYSAMSKNILMTLLRIPSTTMDEYSSWAEKPSGVQYVIGHYHRYPFVEFIPFTGEGQEMVRENVQKNFVDLVNKYPDTLFYIFYTPYSILSWDSVSQEGMLELQLGAEEIATELLLECPNVRLYNFNDNRELINNMDNYRDKEHYNAEVNSWILQWMKDGVGLVTKENYERRLAQDREYFLNYDYESMYQRCVREAQGLAREPD